MSRFSFGLSVSIGCRAPAAADVAVRPQPGEAKKVASRKAAKPAVVPAKPLVAAGTDHQARAANGALVHNGTLECARRAGSHVDIHQLDAPDAELRFMLAPPHVRGAFGCVSYALSADKVRYAAKSVFVEASVQQAWSRVSVMNEARALREVSIAQNVPDAVGSIAAVRTSDRLVHVIQLMDGSWADLPQESPQASLTRNTEGFLRSARSLASFHKSRILHGDIKLDNLFWNQRGIVKWGDYGTSEPLSEWLAPFGKRGTPFAMAPEICRDNGFGLPSDMWSFGIALSEMFVGRVDSPYQAGGGFTEVLNMQKSVVDEHGKLSAAALSAGTSAMHRYFTRFYALSPAACRLSLEELLLENPEHRATASRTTNVAKKLVATLPGHATKAKACMAATQLPNIGRERAFEMLEDAYRGAAMLSPVG